MSPHDSGSRHEAVPIVVDTSVRSDSDYGVTATVSNATAAAQVLGTQVIFWGQPGDPTHDSSRGWACLRAGRLKFDGETCATPSPRPETPFLTLPTSCTGQLDTTMEGLAWTGERLSSTYIFQNPLGEPLASLEGCTQLPFDPTIRTQPQQEAGQPPTITASTPTGLDVEVKLPQQGTITAGELGESDVRATTVTLPQGMLLNPSAANGLAACTEAQIGYEGHGGSDPLSPGAPEPLHFSSDKAGCPDASKIGKVRVKTPLLGEELSGWAYLASQDANPFGSLVAIYIVAENETLGLRVKLVGEGKLDEQTGQVTTTFQNTPQVPFESLELEMFGGPRGALSTPALCGSYTTTSSFTGWSGAVSEPSAEPFNITSGPEGTPCANPMPFAPSFQAGVSNLQAGAFTPFTLTIGHPDADQPLQGLTVHLPAGVAAMLSSLTPCQEPPAGQEWSCRPESLIGHSTAWSGLGSEPVTLPGTAYLTTGYGGAPFGVLVVTPAVAGPFNLGNVNVRSRINVDPEHRSRHNHERPIPDLRPGVPAQIKQLTVTVDRPGFEFNPTSCDPTAITGTITGASGGSEDVSSPFQVGGCAEPAVRAEAHRVASTGRRAARTAPPSASSSNRRGSGRRTSARSTCSCRWSCPRG